MDSKRARPLAFADITRQVGDIFSRDFVPPGIKLDAKTNIRENVSVNVIGSSDPKTDIFNSEIKCKLALPQKGVTFTQSLNSKSKIVSDLEFNEVIAAGLKINANASLVPGETDLPTGKLTSEYRTGMVAARACLDVNRDSASTSADMAFTHGPFTLGGDASFSLKEGLRRYGMALGYRTSNYTVAVTAGQRLSPIGISLYNRISRDVEIGARVTYPHSSGKKSDFGKAGEESGLQKLAFAAGGKKGGDVPLIELAFKKAQGQGTFIKGKVDSLGRVGIAYNTPLNESVRLTFGISSDSFKYKEPGFAKYGVQISFEG